MNHAKTDPHVSCPIVCGEYMRATGFFFAVENQTYLITSRHNVLPTSTAKLATGSHPLNFHTTDYRPIIDIYLRDDDQFTCERIDIRNKQGVRCDERIDIIGIPVEITPEEYGYISWTFNDITRSDPSAETLDSIGFPGQSFPAGDEYSIDVYSRKMSKPYIHSLHNTHQMPSHRSSQTGALDIGLDTDFEDQDTQNTDYEGYSGSPVLGDGLVGVHGANQSTTIINQETNETRDRMAIIYWRAEILECLFGSE